VDEGENTFKRGFIFGVLHARGFLRPRGPKQAQTQSNNTHTQETHKVTTNNIKNTQGTTITKDS
jgi:hypothetical protein